MHKRITCIRSSVWSGKTDTSFRICFWHNMMKQRVHHTWPMNKQSASTWQMDLFTLGYIVFFSPVWGAKMHITVYSPCPQALIYLPAALLSSSHYKINLYLGKRWRYLFLNFLIMYLVICYSSPCCIIYLLCLWGALPHGNKKSNRNERPKQNHI